MKYNNVISTNIGLKVTLRNSRANVPDKANLDSK